MKKLIITVSILLSQWSFAGTGGGGVMMISPEKTPQIVYHMGENDKSVRFAYGQLVDNNWDVQKVEMLKAYLMSDSTLVKALRDSKELNSWAEIK